MKTACTRLFLLLALFLAVSQSQAKDLKVGVINSDQVLANFNEYRQAMGILQDEKQDWDRQIANREAEIQAELEDFRLQENALSPTARSEQRSKIDRKIAELEEFRASIYAEGSGRFYTRNQEVMEPLIERVNEAIQQVAEEEGYDLILDNSVPVVVFVAEDAIDVNLNERVLNKLQGEN